MDGGKSSQRGCGSNAWLYSCCMQNSQTTVKKRNPSHNYPAKPKLHDVVQNSFKRRRADSSENQIVPICGVPQTPSSTLQKRIIGGRPAHFAEFPWQSHIRIREFQCGGGLIEYFNYETLKFTLICSFSVKKVCRHSGSLRSKVYD